MWFFKLSLIHIWLLEIADRTNRRVTQQGTRLDAHERELAGHRQVARTVVGHTGDISRIDERLTEINTGLEHASGRAEMAATAAVGAHDRLDGHENRINGLENQFDGGFNWIFWGGISAIGFVANMLFWRVMIYGANWHPWLGNSDAPGYDAERFQQHHASELNAHWWILVLVFTGVISGIAWIVLSLLDHRDRENNNADGSAEPANVAQTDPVNPTNTAPIEAPEPPPAVDQPTSVFTPSQQVAAQQ